jgi:hypothetical protein
MVYCADWVATAVAATLYGVGNAPLTFFEPTHFKTSRIVLGRQSNSEIL